MNKLTYLLSKLTPNARKYLYWAMLAIAILFLSSLIYNAKTQSAQENPTGTVITKKINMLDYDDGVFEESLFQRVKKDINALNNEMESIKSSFSNDIKEIKSILKELKEKEDNSSNETPKIPEKIILPPKSDGTDARSDRNDILSNKVNRMGDETLMNQIDAYDRLKQLDKGVRRKIDEIKSTWNKSSQDGDYTTASPAESSQKKNGVPRNDNGIEVYAVKPVAKAPRKKEFDSINLTSGSFMDASLLTGVVTSTGNNQPVPMLIRINDLAQLPNEIKADLKGCFVVAEGTAALDQERILSRLLSLSCVTKDGIAIIDAKIKGWVADQDSRPGLDAKPIAKFGTYLARSALAGFIGGLGSAINESTLITQQDIVGRNDTRFKDTEVDTLFKAGLGKGIENVTNNLEQFYMDLAKSTLPVLEVGPTKNITVVLSEGVDLEIKARNPKNEHQKGALG